MKFEIFLINLDSDIDRLDFMDSQFKKSNLTYRRISAVNGRKFIEEFGTSSSRYMKEISDRLNGLSRPLSAGEVGCALSHNQCYEIIEAEGIDYALVFEDDVVLSDNFLYGIEDILKKCESRNYDFIQLTYPYVKNLSYIRHDLVNIFSIELKKFKVNKNLKSLGRLFIAPVFNVFFNLRSYVLINYFKGIIKNAWRNYAGTGCYFINKRTASYLSEMSSQVIYSADILVVKHLFDNPNYDCHSYYPCIARQDTQIFESSIDLMDKRS